MPAIPVSEPKNVSAEMKSMIDRLVDAFVKNPDLESQTKTHQADNPKYSFFFPGREGHEYFLWKRYGSQAAKESEAAPSSASFAAQLPPGAESLSANEAEDLIGHLRLLNATKDKIKAAAEYAAGLTTKPDAASHFVLDYAFNKIAADQQMLHFAYLISEIFNIALRARATGSSNTEAHDKLVAAFYPHLAQFLAHATNEDSRGTLESLLERWRKENVFAVEQMDALNEQYKSLISRKRKRDDAAGESDLPESEAKRRS